MAEVQFPLKLFPWKFPLDIIEEVNYFYHQKYDQLFLFLKNFKKSQETKLIH